MGTVPSLVSAFVVGWTLACGSAPAARNDVAPSENQVITLEQITASGATTAWEALRRTVTGYTFRESGSGTPLRIDHRGRSSLSLSERPIILLDGVRMNDIRVLEQIPASDLSSIEVIRGINATTLYGTNANNGVISIRTR